MNTKISKSLKIFSSVICLNDDLNAMIKFVVSDKEYFSARSPNDSNIYARSSLLGYNLKPNK